VAVTKGEMRVHLGWAALTLGPLAVGSSDPQSLGHSPDPLPKEVPMIRSSLAAVGAALALVLAPSAAHAAAPVSVPSLPQTPFTDAGYWAFADRMQARLDSTWDEQAGYYKLGTGGVEPMANAMMLLTHAVAALQGHEGPTRNDHRARLLAARLVSSPPFVTKPASGQSHAPGWVNSMTNANGGQHLVFDAEVVDGLVYAYRARAALDLPDSTVTKIRSAIDRTARGTFWRWPTIRLNQVNWYALIYAADATVTGKTTMLTHDLRLQLQRFFGDARGTTARAGNFGPGMRFHYQPGSAINTPRNVDSAEYANIVLSFTRFYDQARSAGMPALPAASQQLMHQWVERALSGYWTHSGYMNWDSGLGFDRWHQAKKLGLTQEALVGLASSNSLLPSPRWGQWAKTILDRSLAFYDNLAVREGGIPNPVLFDVTKVPQGRGSANLAATRIMANAARAVDAELGRKTAVVPPALYSYDPDIGRLAVTTPTYNTAIIAVNQKAFPYGGLDLARLFDGDQEVAANIGGRPPASFGVMVRDVNGKRVLASQIGRSAVVRGFAPLRLTKAPSGAGAIASAAIGRAYAGPFTDLRATGTTVSGPLSVTVTHRFTPDWIQTSWLVKRRSGRARYTADVLFPSWAGKTGAARIEAVLRNGSSVTVGDRLIDLADVAYLYVHSQFSGYVVVPATRPAGAGVHIIRTAAQSSEPDPGPTLAIQVARSARFNHAGLTVRLMPVHSEQEAAAAATRLKAS
jgi:hypothetical protein